MRRLAAIGVLVTCAAAAEGTKELSDLPEPIAAYGRSFEGECELNGLGPPVANEMFVERIFGSRDVNGDGHADYMAYACMFGCVGAPFAFVAAGLPCTNGILALSNVSGYTTYNLPGTVNRIVVGPPLRIVTTRMKFTGDRECEAERDCQYVYELRGGRFERLGICPAEGCEDLLTK